MNIFLATYHGRTVKCGVETGVDVALFPGPAQLFITCNRKRRAGLGTRLGGCLERLLRPAANLRWADRKIVTRTVNAYEYIIIHNLDYEYMSTGVHYSCTHLPSCWLLVIHTATIQSCIASFPGSSPAFCRILYSMRQKAGEEPGNEAEVKACLEGHQIYCIVVKFTC